MQLFRKQESTIGLDIGSSMIKVVKMSVKGKTNVLENYALEPIAEGAVQSGEIKDPSSLAQSTLKAVANCDPNFKDVIIALPNYAILSESMKEFFITHCSKEKSSVSKNVRLCSQLLNQKLA